MSNLALTCKACSQVIPADDVNLDTCLAKCRACNAVFEFAPQLETRERAARQAVPMPRNIVVAEGPGSLTILRKWKAGAIGFFFLVFAGFWNLIVSVFVVAAATGKEFKSESGTPVSGGFIWLFLTPFILVGLGTGYAALALLFNRTRVTIEGTRLQVEHRPFRWFGHQVLDASQIGQLYCTEYEAYKSNNQPVYRMCVTAQMKDGSRVALIKGIEDAAQAFYLEDLIERHLRVADRPVAEEYKRPPA